MLSLIKRSVALCLLFLVSCSCQHLCAQESSPIGAAEKRATREAMTLATRQDMMQDIPQLYEKSSWKRIGPAWIVGPGLTLVPTEYFANCMARLELTTNELDKKTLAIPEQPAEIKKKGSFFIPFIVVASLSAGFVGGLIVRNCAK